MCNSKLDKKTYEKMFNLTPEILCVTYLNGRFKYVNPAFNNILGYSNDEIEELSIFSIIHPDDKKSRDNVLLLIDKERQEIVNLEFRYKCKNGNFKWISWNLKFDLDEGVYYGAGHDISNKRNLEHCVYDNNEKLKAIIENMSDAVFIFDNEGKYTTINKTARHMFPTTFHTFRKIGDGLKENKFYDIYGNLAQHENIPATRILKGEKILGCRACIEVNGGTNYYDINGIPVYDSNQKFIAGIQCWNNVTETVLYQRLLQNQFDFWYKMIDDLDLPFITLSYMDFSITDINQKALNIIEGINPQMNSVNTIKGQKYSDVITDFTKDDMVKHFDMIKQKKETSYKECKELIVFGKKLFVNIVYQPIHELDGNIHQVIAIIIDVTKETRAKLDLEKNMRLQEEFFLNVSHELKTPLNVIFSAVQLFGLYIKNGSLIENQNKLEKYINVITQNCYRQSKLVNNIVDLSKIESGFFKLHLSNQNIVSIVDDIVQSISDYVENKGLKVIFDTNIEKKIIACDPINIERVMLNLISNAIKFSSKGDEILINILDKGDSVAIAVTDTGIGIEADQLASVFERFKQVDKSLYRNSEGSGIGLCLVKSIVELHNGIIKLESEIGKGSKFTVELPSKLVKIPDCIDKSISSKIQTINIEFSDIYT